MSDTYPKSAKLTDEIVRRLPFTLKGQAKIRDEECRGFLLVLGMKTKTFSAKVERVVSGVREPAYQSFGSFDPAAPDHVGVKDARKAAAKWIADYKSGAKVAAKRGGTTLKEAWARYRARLEAKGRQSFKTVSVECGVGKLEAKILMNHKVDRDVHDGYATTPELREHLHGCQARISAGIMGRLASAMGPALLLATDLVPAIASAKRTRVARIKRMSALLQHPG